MKKIKEEANNGDGWLDEMGEGSSFVDRAVVIIGNRRLVVLLLHDDSISSVFHFQMRLSTSYTTQ